ncbi:MAG: S1/P1 nuclease [Cyclobacteriaceae bacterium]
MKKLALGFSFLFLVSFTAFSWGKTGHRVIGLIAQKHLTKKTQKTLRAVLGDETLAEVSTFMDFIRSDRKYDYMVPWHYATIPDSLTYEQAGTPEEGDVIVTIERLINELKTKQFSDEDEAFTIKLLVHLVGDIHQPLHVGNGKDKGGNDLKLDYFWKSSNLHRVWDSGIIDGQKYSYSEYTGVINHASKKEIEKWQSDGVLDWAYESKTLRQKVYDLPESKKISYRYDYDNLEIVNRRLLQAGIRLAGILNEIYG